MKATVSNLRKKALAYGTVLVALVALGLPIQGRAAEALPHFCYDDTQACGPSNWGRLADESALRRQVNLSTCSMAAPHVPCSH